MSISNKTLAASLLIALAFILNPLHFPFLNAIGIVIIILNILILLIK